MWRGLASIMVGLMGLAVLAGCDRSAGAQLHLGETIRIGMNLESSGDRESFAYDASAGAEIAFNQANQAGGINGKQIQLVWANNGSGVGRAAALTTQLMTQGKVLAVFGPVTTDIFLPTLSIADKQEIVAVSSMACGAGVLNRSPDAVHDYAFRSCIGYPAQGAAMAEFAIDTWSAQSAMVLRAADGPFADYADAFTEMFTGAGGTVTGQEAFKAGETDFGWYVDQVRQIDANVVYVAGPPAESAHMIRALRDAGLTQPVLGTDALDSPTLVEVAGSGALNKVYFTTNFTPLDADNPRAQQFVEAYRTAYQGAEPNQASALGHDAALLIVDAVKRASGNTGVDVQKALAATNNLEGATGRLSVGANHEVIKDALVVELVDGSPASVTHVKP